MPHLDDKKFRCGIFCAFLKERFYEEVEGFRKKDAGHGAGGQHVSYADTGNAGPRRR